MEQITYISPKPKRFSWKLREVWRYRDLVLLLTRKNFTVTYKQTVLGPAWIVIPPILAWMVYIAPAAKEGTATASSSAMVTMPAIKALQLFPFFML